MRDHGASGPRAGETSCGEGTLSRRRSWSGYRRRCAGGLGETQRPPGEGARSREFAVRVLRAGLDRGLAGPGDVACAAAAAGGDADGGARDDRGGVLRRGGEPGAAVGAAPAVRSAGGRVGGPGSWVGRGRNRGVRAGVLREPVRVDGAAVRALRHRAVDARSGRAGGLARRESRADHAGAGLVLETGDHPHPDPGKDRDGYSDSGAGPVPGRSAAVRVPAGRCGPAPEQGARRLGTSGAPPRTRPGYGARSAVDVRAAAGRAQRRADHPRAE